MMRKGHEAQTIARAVGGDEASQRQIYESHHAAAYRLAYLLLRNTMDAEEVVQDAFVYAYRNLDRYDAERGSFWTWLRVILVSRCRNRRRRKRLPGVSLEALRAVGKVPADTKPSSDPADALERWDTRRVVYEALEEVSPGARDALVLRYYEGLAYAEIAQILGCSNEAARSRVVHGKSQLRHLLAGREEQMTTDHEAVRRAVAG
jgi:RNA polymerase sigma-70 factor (ECF subfamily)